MKTKQEQIEEIVKDIKSILIKTHKRCRTLQEDYMQDKYAENLCKAGYRKASDVIEDFVKKLIDFPHWLENGTVLVIHMEELLELAAEMRQEVEK